MIAEEFHKNFTEEDCSLIINEIVIDQKNTIFRQKANFRFYCKKPILTNKANRVHKIAICLLG